MEYHTDFNHSKYTRWYYELIQHRRLNPPTTDQYRERHHIIPESFYVDRKRDGGSGWLLGDPDDSDNLVWLTAREHALAHWLLTKMTVDNERAYGLMVYSFNMMWVGGEHQGREMSRMITRAYERNRIEWSRIHSETMKNQFANGREAWNKGRPMDEEQKQKISRSKTGKKLSPEVAEAKRLRQIGRKMSQESSEKKRLAMTGLIRGSMSEEHRKKISESCCKPKKSGHGDKVRLANIGRKIINKNGIEKRVTADELQSYLDDDWLLGRP